MGEGEPLLAEREDAGSGGWLLPIAKRPLSGPPSEHRTDLTDSSFPVPRDYYSDARYWLELQSDAAVLRSPAERLRAGDLLLQEMDVASWQAPEDVNDKLCVVDIRSETRPGLKLVKVEYGMEVDEGWSLWASVFDDLPEKRELLRGLHLYERPDGGWDLRQTRHAASRAPGRAGIPPRRVSASDSLPGHRPISLQDIVSVTMLTVRR
ncbi:MAG: hypothetical protein ABIP48_15790 [Planctomycetota bacterium]